MASETSNGPTSPAATAACDWCSELHRRDATGAARWLMGALRHTAGAATQTAQRHEVQRPGRMLSSCPDCAPLVRAHDVDGLATRAAVVLEAQGRSTGVDRVEHALIFRAIDRALVTEVADETARPTKAERDAWALASAHTTRQAVNDLGGVS